MLRRQYHRLPTRGDRRQQDNTSGSWEGQPNQWHFLRCHCHRPQSNQLYRHWYPQSLPQPFSQAKSLSSLASPRRGLGGLRTVSFPLRKRAWQAEDTSWAHFSINTLVGESLESLQGMLVIGFIFRPSWGPKLRLRIGVQFLNNVYLPQYICQWNGSYCRYRTAAKNSEVELPLGP